MIEYVQGKGLWTNAEQQAKGALPFMIIRCIVTGECGCRVCCGLLSHNHEQGISWYPCGTHLDQEDGPHERFRRSLTEDPQARPVEVVIEEFLA